MQLNTPDTLHLPDGQVFSIKQDNAELHLQLADKTLLKASIQPGTVAPLLTLEEYNGELLFCLQLLTYFFVRQKQQSVLFDLSKAEDSAIFHCLNQGLLVVEDISNSIYRSEPSLFWQQASPWLQHAISHYPLSMQMSEGKYHPKRAPTPQGEVYRRYIPELDMYFSLLTADLQQHLPYLHQWMNNPRVDHFWQESGDEQKHREYLTRLIQDPHTHVLIGCFNDLPFAYFEAYWAKEDRIAPFYQADNYDRGIHMLVGDDKQRGPHKVMAWLPSLVHYLFLQDPRTQRVVSEPRADNDKMIHYLQQTGFCKQKEFDFPHKRAALMSLERQVFFELCPLIQG